MKFLERFWNGCGHCQGEAECPLLQDAARTYACNPWFTGRTLVGIAVTIFLVPLAAAIAGAYLAQWLWSSGTPASDNLWQSLGLLGGLALGVGLAKLLVNLSRVTRHLVTDGDRE
ncbi:MAG: hypothetical protein JXO22_01545 [Phycisphaerae bacterium]|nr:hypothetical protein [Phycisphaerae bacterium]